jgi:hypothetical protein
MDTALAGLPVSNAAVTAFAEVMLTVQVAEVPVQAPLQPEKVESVDGAAVRVTVTPAVKALLQLLLHAIPLGEEVTAPVPVPVVVRVRVYVFDALRAKVAVRLLAPSTTRVQLPVPAHAPLQPVKVEPDAGLALRARLVPKAKEALQVLPQSIPLGLEDTVPAPVPALVTATV